MNIYTRTLNFQSGIVNISQFYNGFHMIEIENLNYEANLQFYCKSSSKIFTFGVVEINVNVILVH